MLHRSIDFPLVSVRPLPCPNHFYLAVRGRSAGLGTARSTRLPPPFPHITGFATTRWCATAGGRTCEQRITHPDHFPVAGCFSVAWSRANGRTVLFQWKRRAMGYRYLLSAVPNMDQCINCTQYLRTIMIMLPALPFIMNAGGSSTTTTTTCSRSRPQGLLSHRLFVSLSLSTLPRYGGIDHLIWGRAGNAMRHDLTGSYGSRSRTPRSHHFLLREILSLPVRH